MNITSTPHGSPPRMRGKLRKDETGKEKIRITPADAGKTVCDVRDGGKCEDHPRGCGENLLVCLEQKWCAGSPPRMRGKQRVP